MSVTHDCVEPCVFFCSGVVRCHGVCVFHLCPVFLQEGHPCCVQELRAWSRPHHTLHGGGRSRVRPRGHRGFRPAEVGSENSLSRLSECRICRLTLRPSNRCIGSIQHLKGKYGRGYSLEVKLREELTGLQQVAHLHDEILRIFPHAARQER